MKFLQILVFIFILPFTISGQHNRKDFTEYYSHSKTIRIAGFIGHTLIKCEDIDSHIIIPSWGFDLEYWFRYDWGIGLHNDLELESFIIRTSKGEVIKRTNPLVISIDALYKLENGLVFSSGPGVELANQEQFALFRFGVEYEKEILNGVDISTTVFYDHRFQSYGTWTIALGVGKRF